MKISVKGVSKSFEKDRYILKDISIDIDDGSFTTLLGPSGCGKTTLLRMLSGLEIPDEGEIWFDDVCVFSREKGMKAPKINIPPEKRNVGFVFQDFALWPHMTVFENVAFGLRARKITDNLDEKVYGALDMVHLKEFADRYPAQLSGGQQQRVSFARAIAMNPKVVFFDEPFSALDALLREDMRTEVRRITKDMGITSVFVTHDQSEAMSMSDRIVVMNEGHIEQNDIPEEVYNEPSSVFVARFVGKSNWIDDKRMYRPENAVVVDSDVCQTDVFAGKVVSSQFMGNGYDVIVDWNDHRWLAYMQHSPAIGDRIFITVKKDDIVSFL